MQAPAWEAILGTDHGPTAHQPGHDPADFRPSGVCVLRPSWYLSAAGARGQAGAELLSVSQREGFMGT